MQFPPNRRIRTVLLSAVFSILMLLQGISCSAQFKKEAFTQSYNDDGKDVDTTEQVFNFRKFAGALTHKGEADVTTMFEGSTIVIGSMQIYNRQYWKLPIIYGGIAAGVTGGILYGKAGNTKASTMCYLGAGLTYWATLLDGTINYKPQPYPSPGIPPLYALLVPGLGQIYNHEMWKLPIYWGGLIGSTHYYIEYKQNYIRFRDIYNDAASNAEYDGPIPAETAKYYRNLYRRYRDYSVIAFVAFYFLQAIDANVFAYMHNFEITDDLALDIGPSVTSPIYASAGWNSSSAVGMGLTLRF